MKTKYSLLIVISLATMLTSMAQLKPFTLDDLIPGGKNYRAMQPATMANTWWGNRLIRLESTKCSILNPGNRWATLTEQQDVKDAMSAAGLNAKDCPSLAAAKFPDASHSEMVLQNAKCLLIYDWKLKKLAHYVTFKTDASWHDYSAAAGAVAYNRGNNLYIAKTNHAGNDEEALQVSTDGSHDIVYGQSVHRNEFGISKGTFWSPDGKRLCFYRMDQSMVPDYPLVDIGHRIAEPQPIKYPMAGTASHKVSIGIFNMRSKETVWLETGDNTNQYYCGITWSPDSRKIYLYNLNRDQNHARLIQFDASTGRQEKVIMEERHAKYVEPQHGLTFLPWDDDKFIYWSQQSGYDNLYLYSLKQGRAIRNLTSGHKGGVVLDLLGFNPAQRSVIISTTWAAPLQHNLFSVRVDDGQATPLDGGQGVHSGKLSADGSQIIDSWTSPDVPRKVDLVQTATGKRVTLLENYGQWKGHAIPEITCGTLKAADGKTDLFYRMVKPVNFDANKKYPAIVYVYGGPHTRLVNASWGYGYRGWEIYMAQLGYVMFILDGRGSSERGLEFENVTFRQLGTEEMRDQMRGVEFLKSLPYVDGTRLGVHGWSFGGFMTTDLMLTYPEVFKAGVAGGPVIDWSLYEVMYGERYMDTPQTNPEGYHDNNLCLRAGNLKGRLLIVFGYNDPVCVPQHTLSFLRACADAGTHPDLFTYPGAEHNMAGHDRVHLYEHITRYFEDHLK